MNTITVYIIFALLLSLSISITAMACMFCSRWHKTYLKLKAKYDSTKNENIKLQHEVYKLTYITPSVDTKKGKRENGTK